MDDKERNRRNTIGCLAVAGIIVLVLVLADVFFILRNRATLNGEIARMKAAGQPTNLDEWFDSLEPIPENENGAPLITEAADKIIDLPNEKDKKLIIQGLAPDPVLDMPLPPEMTDIAREYLDKNAEAIRLATEGADRPRRRYATTKESLTMFPYLNSARSCARLLCLDAYMAARNHQSKKATQAIIAAMNLSKFENDEILPIHLLVSMAVLRMTTNNLPRCLAVAEFDDKELADLSSVLQSFEVVSKIPIAHLNDRIFPLDESYDLEKVGLFNYSDLLLPKTAIKDILPKEVGHILDDIIKIHIEDANIVNYCEHVEKISKAWQLPQNKIKPELMKLKKPKNEPLLFMIGQLFINPNYYFIITLRIEALRNSCLTGLAVERFRLRHGRLPDKLAELVPEFLSKVPPDPFDPGKPLRYWRGIEKIEVPEEYRGTDGQPKEISRRVYKIYSVEENGVDDGGSIKFDGKGGFPDIGLMFLDKTAPAASAATPAK